MLTLSIVGWLRSRPGRGWGAGSNSRSRMIRPTDMLTMAMQNGALAAPMGHFRGFPLKRN